MYSFEKAPRHELLGATLRCTSRRRERPSSPASPLVSLPFFFYFVLPCLFSCLCFISLLLSRLASSPPQPPTLLPSPQSLQLLCSLVLRLSLQTEPTDPLISGTSSPDLFSSAYPKRLHHSMSPDLLGSAAPQLLSTPLHAVLT